MKQDETLIAGRRREAAQRALAEAEARRRTDGLAPGPSQPVELGGRNGPEPTRFGDWELNGIATDF